MGIEVMTTDRTLFENDSWTVTGEALEHKASGYEIGRGQIARRRDDGLWAWPSHVLQKDWAEPEPFAEAFSAAAHLFGFETDEGFVAAFAEEGLTRSPSSWRRETAVVVAHPAMTEPAAPDTRRQTQKLRRRRG